MKNTLQILMTQDNLQEFLAVAANLEKELIKLQQELQDAEGVLSALQVEVQRLNQECNKPVPVQPAMKGKRIKKILNNIADTQTQPVVDMLAGIFGD